MIPDDPTAQNEMLDRFKTSYPQFGPKPDMTPPVLRTDGERLEEARRALREVMNMTFGARGDGTLRAVWNLCNGALGRTSKAQTVDTVP